jgi:L-alanine-DL-glutamate epimerase-like enolase superfamily enzyme
MYFSIEMEIKKVNMKRRNFISNTLQTSFALFVGQALTQNAFGEVMSFSQKTVSKNFPKLLDLNQLIPNPVIIDQVQILEFEKNLFVKVTSKDGIAGITMANERMENLYSLLNGLVAPIFKGQDVRNLTELVYKAYADNRNYKYAGSMPLSNCIGHVEIAVLDLLGKIAKLPVNQLFGKAVLTEVPVYLSSLTRETTPAQESEFLAQKLQETGAKAIKIKVGGRMDYSTETTKRDKTLLPAVRKLMPETIIYVDANSSFDLKMGIETGKMLEDYQVDIFEEPCKWEDYESNQKVNKALKKLKLAGGEQDTSLFRWTDICKNDVYDVLQPDLYYNGGIIKALQVAELAHQYGKKIAPHSPKADPLAMPFLHFVGLIPNLYGFQEYPARPAKQPTWYNPQILVKDGKLQIPTGTGLGINYDEEIWAKAKVIF